MHIYAQSTATKIKPLRLATKKIQDGETSKWHYIRLVWDQKACSSYSTAGSATISQGLRAREEEAGWTVQVGRWGMCNNRIWWCYGIIKFSAIMHSYSNVTSCGCINKYKYPAKRKIHYWKWTDWFTYRMVANMVADRLKQQWLYMWCLFLCTRIRDIACLDHLTNLQPWSWGSQLLTCNACSCLIPCTVGRRQLK